MPSYTITDPQTRKTVTLTGDSPPTEAELSQIFATVNAAPSAVATDRKPLPPAAPPTSGRGAPPAGAARGAMPANGRGAPPPSRVAGPPALQALNAVAEMGHEPNTAGTLLRHVGAQLDPRGLAQVAAHPIQAYQGIAAAHENVRKQMIESFDKGDYLEAARHLLGYVIPAVGPILDEAGNRTGRGEYAAGIGDTLGLAAATVGPKALSEAGGLSIRAPLTNGNPVEAAAVRFGQDRGIPVDAGTASGNRFVKGIQAVADHSPGGSLVAEHAKTNTAAQLTRVAGELSDRAHPDPVTAEQAGHSVRGAVQKLTGDLGAQADQAYGKLREIEADPKHSQLFPTAPEGSPAAKSILGKLAAGLESGQAPTSAELRMMRQIEAELDMQPYQRGKLVNDGGEMSSRSHYARGQSNADVYHEILQAAPGTSDISGAEMVGAIRKTLSTGEWSNASRGAFDVARARLRSGTSGPLLPSNTPLVGSLERVNLPVDVSAAQKSLQALYDRLKRESELVPLQGDKGRALVALDRLVNGPAVASVSTVDAVLGDLKAMARADIPELRTQGQGVAAEAVKQLDRQVRAAVAKAGEPAVSALEGGRSATVAKYQVGDVLKSLHDEPVHIYRQATAPKDAEIGLLRQVQEAAPGEVQKIGRAYLDDLFGQATAEGGFDKAAKLQADWQRMGPETKKILFPDAKHRVELDRFFLLAKKLAERPNPSGSALVGSQAAGFALMFTNPAAGVPIAIGGTALSALLHSQAGVRALTRALSVNVGPAVAPAVKAAAATNVIRIARELEIPLPKAAQGPSSDSEPGMSGATPAR